MLEFISQYYCEFPREDKQNAPQLLQYVKRGLRTCQVRAIVEDGTILINSEIYDGYLSFHGKLPQLD